MEWLRNPLPRLNGNRKSKTRLQLSLNKSKGSGIDLMQKTRNSLILILVGISCLVLEQKKVKHGYLTTCKGIEVDGQVILNRKVEAGASVEYRPFIFKDDGIIHGDVVEATETIKEEKGNE